MKVQCSCNNGFLWIDDVICNLCLGYGWVPVEETESKQMVVQRHNWFVNIGRSKCAEIYDRYGLEGP